MKCSICTSKILRSAVAAGQVEQVIPLGRVSFSKKRRKKKFEHRIEKHIKRLPQKIPEAVAADLADEGGLSAKPGVHRQNIRRCAAGVAGKERDALRVFSVRREVD